MNGLSSVTDRPSLGRSQSKRPKWVETRQLDEVGPLCGERLTDLASPFDLVTLQADRSYAREEWHGWPRTIVGSAPARALHDVPHPLRTGTPQILVCYRDGQRATISADCRKKRRMTTNRNGWFPGRTVPVLHNMKPGSAGPGIPGISVCRLRCRPC
jgi:hypothetical protein